VIDLRSIDDAAVAERRRINDRGLTEDQFRHELASRRRAAEAVARITRRNNEARQLVDLLDKPERHSADFKYQDLALKPDG
jgi:hypothetical protein